MPKVKLSRAYVRYGGPGEVDVDEATAKRLQAREARLNAKAEPRMDEGRVDADGNVSGPQPVEAERAVTRTRGRA
jgi:hypothetical protein